MSNIVLSASVRQNLLSLQSTADLLATTQNRLATGKKVNTALDNPTNFFTAASLDNRASDISNLLDGIGNGVQVLQAANTGITSLQSLVDSAKSVANQALQAAVGYSTKSSVTATVAGATADNLLGGVATNAALTGTSALATLNLTSGAATNAVATGSVALAATTTAQTAASAVGGTYTGNEFVSGDALTIDGVGIAFDGTTDGTTAIAGASYTIAEAVDKINTDLTAGSSGVVASVGTGANAGKIVLTNATSAGATGNSATVSSTVGNTGTGGFTTSAANFTGGANAAGGIDASGGAKSFTITLDGGTATTVTLATNGGTHSDGHYSASDLSTAINSALTGAGVTTLAASVNGTNHLVLTSTSGTTGTGDIIAVADVASSGVTASLGLAASTTGSAAAGVSFKVNSQTVTLAGGASYTATQIKDAINTQVGTSAKVAATLDGTGHLVLTSTNTAGGSDAVTVDTFSAGTDASELGFAAAASATASGSASSGGLNGLTLNIAATGNGTATAITFGSASGNVKSLNDLNNALAANNLQATLSTGGKISISTTNDAASSTIGAITGTATDTGNAFNGLTIAGPVQDQSALLNRSNLVSQYNNILDQITTTSQDASFNGINLLNGDQLKLTFNETGTSTLKIQGVSFNAAGLSLSKLTAGTDFLDNTSANNAIASLDKASSTLRTEASSLGSNLSIVQIRQDFSKNLINVLQTGSSNLTLADTNEEAANSQALSTRQSIAVSALALANQSQQSVLQLLR